MTLEGTFSRSFVFRSLVLALVVPLFGGCGYVVMKRSDLEKRTRVVVDSTEVVSLRQQIAALEQRSANDTAQRTVPPTNGATPPAKNLDSVVKARDAEITALKEQLAKATDELERIKRRLATPRQ